MTTIPDQKCPHCGAGPHQGVCPTIKAIEYYENGQVKRVEYKCPTDFVPMGGVKGNGLEARGLSV